MNDATLNAVQWMLVLIYWTCVAGARQDPVTWAVKKAWAHHSMRKDNGFVRVDTSKGEPGDLLGDLNNEHKRLFGRPHPDIDSGGYHYIAVRARRRVVRDLKVRGLQALLNDLNTKALGVRQMPTNKMLTYTLDDINAQLGLPPGDTSMESAVDGCLTSGEDVYYCLASCWARVGDNVKAQRYLDMSDAYQASLVQPIPPSLSLQALTPPHNAIAQRNAQVQQRIAQVLTSTLTSYTRGLLGSSGQSGFNPYRPWPQGPSPVGQPLSSPRPQRRPDPVSDPYLAANDFADELRDHLGLDAADVGALPVKAYMIWVAIRAAQKDGGVWDDLDARLHEIAGVAYVSPAERRALELSPVAGALAIAEWATVDRTSDVIVLYMMAGHSYAVAWQDLHELDVREYVQALLARAPSAVTYQAYLDMETDRIIISDGKTRRYLDRPTRSSGSLANSLAIMGQGVLHDLWLRASAVS